MTRADAGADPGVTGIAERITGPGRRLCGLVRTTGVSRTKPQSRAERSDEEEWR
jgi:hypothetical protein